MLFENLWSWFDGVKRDATLKINLEAHDHGDGHKLNRHLGLVSVFLFTVTSAVGAGILTTPGIIANQHSGSYAWLSYLMAGAVCLPAALCLAKMASMTSRSGSTGSYACLVLGQLVGMLMFVDVMMECIGGTAAVAVSQADHIKMMLRVAFDYELPRVITTSPADVNWSYFFTGLTCGIGGGLLAFKGWGIWKDETSGEGTLQQANALTGSRKNRKFLAGLMLGVGGLVGIYGLVYFIAFHVTLPSVNLLAVIVVAGITVILLRGVKETAFLTNIFTVVKLLLLLVIVAILGSNFDWSNINRPIPEDLTGPIGGAALAFFAFVGLDMATMTAGETRNPKRNVPLGMVLGLGAVTVLYVLASFTLCGAVPYEQLAGEHGHEQAAPMVKALEILGYKSAVIAVGIGSTVALVSVLLASAYASTRLLYNMAQHGLLPPIFCQVSANRKVPVFATLVIGGFVSILCGTLVVDELMHLCNIGTMTAFITVSLTVFVWTIRHTNWKDGKELRSGIFWIVVSVAGALGSGRLMLELPWTAFARLLVVWTIVCLIFVFYSRHHSLARTQAANLENE